MLSRRIGGIRKDTLILTCAVVLAGMLLVAATRGVSWDQVVEIIASSRTDALGFSVLTLCASYVIRAVRWHVLLGHHRAFPLRSVAAATFVGYLGNNFLPARAGEVIRTVMAARAGGISKSFVLATVITERVTDVATLVMMGGVALAALQQVPEWLGNGARSGAIMGGIGMLGLLVGSRAMPVVQRRVSSLPLPERILRRLDPMATQFTLGLRTLQHPLRGLAFLLLTIIVWSLDVAFAVQVAQGLHVALDPFQAILLLAALGFSSAAPSTPGYVGVYQFVAVSVLVPLGFRQDEAVSYILVFQALSYAVVVVLGVVGLWLGRGLLPRFLGWTGWWSGDYSSVSYESPAQPQ